MKENVGYIISILCIFTAAILLTIGVIYFGTQRHLIPYGFYSLVGGVAIGFSWLIIFKEKEEGENL